MRCLSKWVTEIFEDKNLANKIPASGMHHSV